MAYQKRVAVIGGGAAGLCAAIAATEAGAAVVIYERGNRVGKKLLATGNGRCNLSNRYCDVTHYHGAEPEFVRPALTRYSVEETLQFFFELGVLTIEEDEGKIYPRSLQASAVLDALRLETERLGIMTVCDCEIVAVQALKRGGFSLRSAQQSYYADSVIMATGGAASAPLGGSESGCRLLEQLGHRISLLRPAIVQLKTDTTTIKPLNGIKVNGSATLLYRQKPVQTLSGEILFTEYGLSGPPIMQLSTLATRQLAEGKGMVEIALDLMPDMTEEALFQLLGSRAAARPDTLLENYLSGMINKRLGQTALKAAGLAPLSGTAGALSEQSIRSLAARLKAWRVTVRDTNGMRQAQVTAGGALTQQFDAKTLQSLLVLGVFGCGEVLDIDGDCGGFNLQWAWSSGRLAGENAAQG